MSTPKPNMRIGTTTRATQKPTLQLAEEHRGDDGAEHVAGAVGEVDDPEHAEDHGEAQRGQRVEAAGGEPLEGVLDEFAHVSRSVRVRSGWAPAAAPGRMPSGASSWTPPDGIRPGGQLIEQAGLASPYASAAGIVFSMSS